MKKTLYTLRVDNYAPEICDITFPLLKHYARKIGAEFRVITDRLRPDLPPVMEKFQILEIARENPADWHVYIDADAVVHPDMYDPTEYLNKNEVFQYGKDRANGRYRFDEHFRRDGRDIGSCNWFTIVSDWCLDLWSPLDMPLSEAVDNIFPREYELNTVITRDHLVDDYWVSRNIARFGLDFVCARDLKQRHHIPREYVWHEYTIPVTEKVNQMREVVSVWGIGGKATWRNGR